MSHRKRPICRLFFYMNGYLERYTDAEGPHVQ